VLPDVKQLALGEAEVMDELFASFGLAMLTGILCIYIVLVLLFKDFLHPFTILTALPLSLGASRARRQRRPPGDSANEPPRRAD